MQLTIAGGRLPQDKGGWQAVPPLAFLFGLWFHFLCLSQCIRPFSSPCRLALSGLLAWLSQMVASA